MPRRFVAAGFFANVVDFEPDFVASLAVVFVRADFVGAVFFGADFFAAARFCAACCTASIGTTAGFRLRGGFRPTFSAANALGHKSFTPHAAHAGRCAKHTRRP